MTWKAVNDATKKRVRSFMTGVKNSATDAAKMVGSAMVGGLIGTDLASAKAEAKAKEVGEHMRAIIAEKVEQTKAKQDDKKDKITNTWKQAAGRITTN